MKLTSEIEGLISFLARLSCCWPFMLGEPATIPGKSPGVRWQEKAAGQEATRVIWAWKPPPAGRLDETDLWGLVWPEPQLLPADIPADNVCWFQC